MAADRFLHQRAGHSVKVNSLGDLEYRVWTQYLLSADDFGVMRGTVVAFQADNDSLSTRPVKQIEKAIVSLLACGLVDQFEHQGHRYLFQRDWQSWQKVSYPRGSTNPRPQDDAFAKCDDDTMALFGEHPGGKGRKVTGRSKAVQETFSEHSANIPETFPEGSLPTRVGAPAKWLVASGERLMANGSEESARETNAPPASRPDVWCRELVALYPASRRVHPGTIERVFLQALIDAEPLSREEAWLAMKARLENHKRSHEWRVKGMIPSIEKWLREGRHMQELPEHPPSMLMSEKTARTLSSAAAFINGGKSGAA